MASQGLSRASWGPGRAPDGIIRCFCPDEALRLQSKQPATFGMIFYKCNKRPDSQKCRFWHWEAEVPHAVPTPPQQQPHTPPRDRSSQVQTPVTPITPGSQFEARQHQEQRYDNAANNHYAPGPVTRPSLDRLRAAREAIDHLIHVERQSSNGQASPAVTTVNGYRMPRPPPPQSQMGTESLTGSYMDAEGYYQRQLDKGKGRADPPPQPGDDVDMDMGEDNPEHYRDSRSQYSDQESYNNSPLRAMMDINTADHYRQALDTLMTAPDVVEGLQLEIDTLYKENQYLKSLVKSQADIIGNS